MLKPTYVAEQIVKSMQTKKREVNLPKWMGIGPKLYALFPGLFERVAGNHYKIGDFHMEISYFYPALWQ